jgi:hypothetical protein
MRPTAGWASALPVGHKEFLYSIVFCGCGAGVWVSVTWCVIHWDSLFCSFLSCRQQRFFSFRICVLSSPWTAPDGLHSWVILLYSVDYATITLQLCKQKKRFMFYYRNMICMGIVRFDVYPTNSPSNKQHHHGEPFAATAAWLKRISSPHPRGPLRKGSSEVEVKGF